MHSRERCKQMGVSFGMAVPVQMLLFVKFMINKKGSFGSLFYWF